MLLPILRVALSVLKMLRWVVLGKENRWQNWEFAVGYDTVQGDTKRLIAVFFKKQKEVNSICRCSSRMVAFQTKTPLDFLSVIRFQSITNYLYFIMGRDRSHL